MVARRPAVRKSVLARLAELTEEHGDELALLDSQDMSKPITDGSYLFDCVKLLDRSTDLTGHSGERLSRVCLIA